MRLKIATITFLLLLFFKSTVLESDFDVEYEVKPLEKVFAEKSTCDENSNWDTCVRRCINTQREDPKTFRDCAGRCRYDADYVTELVIRTDCNTVNGTVPVCAPKNLDLKSCDGRCYPPTTNPNQRPTLICSDPIAYRAGYCLKPFESKPVNISDDCDVCNGNGSSCRDCRTVKWGYSRLDVCGVCDGRGDSCELRVGAIDGGDLIIKDGHNLTISSNAANRRQKEMYCMYKASWTTDIKPILTYDSGMSKITCQPPDVEGEYFGIQLKTKNDNAQENYTNTFTQTYRVMSKSSLAPTSVFNPDVTIEHDIEWITVRMGSSYPSLNKSHVAYCIIQGFGINNRNVTVNGTRDTYDVKCPLEITPNHPGRNLKISIFLNATGELDRAFEVRLRGKAPIQIGSYFLNDGYSLLFVFDQPLDIESLYDQNEARVADDCHYVLSDSELCKFGKNPKCHFINLNQLLITIDTEFCSGQTETSLISPGGSVTLKQNGFGRFGELPSNRANLTQLTTIATWELQSKLTQREKLTMTPNGIINAPQKVRNCSGLIVQIGAVRASRGMTYQWSVKKNGYLVADYDLTQYLLETSRSKNYLNLNLDRFVSGDQVELNVHLQNAFNFQNDIKHAFQIVNTNIPHMLITSSADPNNVYVTQGLILKSSFTLPPCSNTQGKIYYQWTVSCDDDSSRSNEQDLFIDPHVLPSNSTITVTLEGWFEGQSSNRGWTQLILRTKPFETKMPKDEIDFSISKMNNGGMIVLDATNADANQNTDVSEIMYEWTCEMINTTTNDHFPCYMDGNWSSFSPEMYQRTAQVSLDPRKMTTGSYQIKVKVFDKDRTHVEQMFNFTLIDAETPRVHFVKNRDCGFVSQYQPSVLEAMIEYSRSRQIDMSSIRFFSVPFDGPINCSFPNSSAVSTRKLDISSTRFGYIDFALPDSVNGPLNATIINDINGNNGKIYIRQIIADGSLKGDRIYRIAVCVKYTSNGNIADEPYAYSVTQIRTKSIVETVQFSLPTDCSPLEQFVIGVSAIFGSVNDNETKPTYQFGMFDEFDDSVNVLSEASTTPTTQILCFPRSDSKPVMYIVEICIDKACRMFPAKTGVAVRSATIDDLRKKLQNVRADARNFGHYMYYLTVVNAVLQYAQRMHLSGSDFDSLVSTASELQLQLADASVKTLDGRGVDKLKYFLSATKSIDFTKLNNANNNDMRNKVQNMVNNFVNQLKDYGHHESSSHMFLNEHYTSLANAFISNSNSSRKQLLESKRQVSRLARNSIAFGAGPRVNTDRQTSISEFFEKDTTQNKVFRIDSAGIEVKLPSSLKNNNDPMGGIGVEMHYYQNLSYFGSRSNEATLFASKILDILLFDPTTGDDIQPDFSGQSAEITFSNVYRESGKYPTCQYFNEKIDQWASDGVETQDSGSTIIKCYTRHFSAFAVTNMGQPPQTPAPNYENKTPDPNYIGRNGENEMFRRHAVGILLSLCLGLLAFISKICCTVFVPLFTCCLV